MSIGKLLRSISPADAEAFRVWLAAEANDRDNGRDEFSDNTVRRRAGIAKQFFRAPQKRHLIESNPFSRLAVCEWLGNSQAVALEHYAPVTDDHFRAATGEPVRRAEAKSEAEAKQFPKQQASAERGTNSQPHENRQFQTIRPSTIRLHRAQSRGPSGINP